MKETPSIKYQLQISSIEFYLSACFDLLDKHTPITVDCNEGPLSPARIDINEISDLMPILERITKARAAASTKMNLGHNEHGGSSRSHCALILQLH